MKKVFKIILHTYRIFIAPFLNRFSSCRYEPSCSHYMEQAVDKYGFWRGFWQGCARILSCHPFSKRKIYDPVE
ncbi:MAG: membrane protein insertion efficiency factor YidD [Candidatus Pacebacteria bacterium]|nr:membrane protein insertion efficiency factor YidD [Candidatus Paceibacterota bacterium]